MMNNQVQLQPDEVFWLKAKLNSIQECLESGIPFGVTGHPLSTLLMVQSDFLAILKEVIKENRGEKRNPELVFEEQLDSQDEKRDYLDFETDKPYKSVSDPLGNPLQMQIDLGKSYLFTTSVKNALLEFIEHLEELFALVSTGLIDEKIFRSLNQVFKTTISSSSFKIPETKTDSVHVSNKAKQRELKEIQKRIQTLEKEFEWFKRNSLEPTDGIRQGIEEDRLEKAHFFFAKTEFDKKHFSEFRKRYSNLAPLGEITARTSNFRYWPSEVILNGLINDLSPKEIGEYEEKIRRLRQDWHSR